MTAVPVQDKVREIIASEAHVELVGAGAIPLESLGIDDMGYVYILLAIEEEFPGVRLDPRLISDAVTVADVIAMVEAGLA